MENNITYQMIKNDTSINAYIKKANDVLKVMGFTEHSAAHAAKVAETAACILENLGYSEKEIELAKIAGYMHDIGNCVNRHGHAHHGAMISFQILNNMGMAPEDIAVIIAAIGNHDEATGTAEDVISAAIILADKTDVRRNRVQNKVKSMFDIHDRVNYAVISSALTLEPETHKIKLEIVLDDTMCSVMDYFEIFLQRMIMCKKASELLGLQFHVTANNSKIC